MPIFTYSAAGEKDAIKGTKKGLAAVNIRIDINGLIARLRPIGLVDKMFFTRNLAVMVGAGLSLTRTLESLAKEAANPKLKKILLEINDSVIKGKPFAESLRLHKEVFGELFINMIEVGETTGKLTLVLKLLASQMKKDHTLRRRVRGAMFYPAIIIITLLIVGSLMMLYVVPTLTQTIKELEVELPLSTKIIIFISDQLVNYFLWVLAGVVIFAAAFWKILKTRQGKTIFDRLILKAPIFGTLIKKFNSARFCRTLSYLITSGVPIVRSLEISSSVLGHTMFRQAIASAATAIQKGKQLNLILAEYPALFQPLMIQMIQVGEETGKLSEMLLRLALFFEEEVTATTKNMSSIIEPILMIFIGAAVGFFAISMLQPIYSSLGNI